MCNPYLRVHTSPPHAPSAGRQEAVAPVAVHPGPRVNLGLVEPEQGGGVGNPDELNRAHPFKASTTSRLVGGSMCSFTLNNDFVRRYLMSLIMRAYSHMED